MMLLKKKVVVSHTDCSNIFLLDSMTLLCLVLFFKGYQVYQVWREFQDQV